MSQNRENFLPLYTGLKTPRDVEIKPRPGLILDVSAEHVDFVPVLSLKNNNHALPSWALALDGAACAESGLLKASVLGNEVLRVPANSFWVRKMHAIGKIVPQRDRRFAERLAAHLANCQCVVLTARELPRYFVRGSSTPPIKHMTYQTTLYSKLL
jgi:hypothetical protein